MKHRSPEQLEIKEACDEHLAELKEALRSMEDENFEERVAQINATFRKRYYEITDRHTRRQYQEALNPSTAE